MEDDQPDIVDPEVRPSAVVWLPPPGSLIVRGAVKTGRDGEYRKGEIVEISNGEVIVDFYDWTQRYPLDNIVPLVIEQMAWNGPVLVPNSTGSRVDTFEIVN